MSCAVCGRASRGFGFTSKGWGDDRQNLRTCSMRCLNVVAAKGHDMFKLNHYEKQAVNAASDAAGEYLEAIGKTDLATMTRDQWLHLIQLVFVRSTATIQRLSEEDAVPF